MDFFEIFREIYKKVLTEIVYGTIIIFVVTGTTSPRVHNAILKYVSLAQLDRATPF